MRPGSTPGLPFNVICLSPERVSVTTAETSATCGCPAGERDSCRVSAKPDRGRLAASPEREALRAHVDGLEEIRLAGAVGTRDEDEPRDEVELLASIRAEVGQAEVCDDQSARSNLSGQAVRHDEVPEVVAFAGDQTRSQRRDELDAYLGFRERLEALAQELGLKPISSASPE